MWSPLANYQGNQLMNAISNKNHLKTFQVLPKKGHCNFKKYIIAIHFWTILPLQVRI
jgi:hypothetical protein